MVPDPARQYYSPYTAMGNNPINKVDPDGRCETCGSKSPSELNVLAYGNDASAFSKSNATYNGGVADGIRDFVPNVITAFSNKGLGALIPDIFYGIDVETGGIAIPDVVPPYLRGYSDGGALSGVALSLLFEGARIGVASFRGRVNIIGRAQSTGTRAGQTHLKIEDFLSEFWIKPGFKSFLSF